MSFILTAALILVLTTVGGGIYALKRTVEGSKGKLILGMNAVTFFGLLIGATVFCFSGMNVQAAGEVVAATGPSTGAGLGYLAAALSTGLAAIGAGIGVGITGSAALGTISENPKLLGKTLIYVGLAEGIAIYGIIISIMIIGKL